MAPANFLVCDGLITEKSMLCFAQAIMNSCSNLPVASITIEMTSNKQDRHFLCGVRCRIESYGDI